MNKLHSREISRKGWNIMVWSLIIVGAFIFVTSNSILMLLLGQQHKILYITGAVQIGMILIGFGFGLAYARLWKIRGIDHK